MILPFKSKANEKIKRRHLLKKQLTNLSKTNKQKLARNHLIDTPATWAITIFKTSIDIKCPKQIKVAL